MSPSTQPDVLATLPLPVAVLARRARNAKSPKERHDTAWFAWEASLRIAVAAHPPADASALTLPACGHWVRAARVSDETLDADELRDVLDLLREVGEGKDAHPRAASARRLLDALPAYRNQVLGHGSIRGNAFYDAAAEKLLRGLLRAWTDGVFLPSGSHVVFVEAVEIDSSGRRRARVLGLVGLASTLEDDEVTVPGHVLPRRLWLRKDETWTSLHPWVLFEADELRERAYFFNGWKRSGEYLDFVSGETLKGAALEALFPGALEELRALLSAEAPKEETENEDATRFGSYRILGKLGEGGMGAVYLARQETLDRLVAVKMLPAGLAGDATAVGRFRREVAALARCDHPHVVRILASGEARASFYLAMEYIAGADLAQVAKILPTTPDVTSAVSEAAAAVRRDHADMFAGVPDLRHASTPQALPAAGSDRYRQLGVLLRDAALGLHHLHERGILHRDVKPANLMVTAEDGRIVIMDLGLAAVKDASRTLTRNVASVLGTLRYMAPEQLQRNLVSVDRRADVFSLGATFYELVAGRPLRDGDTEARLVEQVLRERAPAASQVVPGVPRDLSVILGKATEPDPRLRYDTAAALAADVSAWLANQPIAARPPTLGYVLRLAVRRNKIAAAGVTVALLALVSLAIGMSVLWRRSEASLERAVAAEAASRREALTAERTVDFVIGLFEGSDPGVSLGKDVTARELLDRGATRIEGELAAEPLARAKMLIALGRVYEELAAYEKAELFFQEALEIRRRELGDHHLDVAEGLSRLGRLNHLRHDYERALPLHEQALAIRVDLLGREDALVAENLMNIGVQARMLGDRKRARALFEEAIAIRERIEGPDSLGVASAVGNLATVLTDLRELTEARALHERALAIQERVLGPDHPDVAHALANVAAVRRSLGDHEGSLAAARRSLAIAEKTLGPDHPDVAHSLLRVAQALAATGDLAGARSAMERGIAINEKAFGLDHVGLAPSLQNLANFLVMSGDPDGARSLVQRAVAIHEKAFGPDHGDLAPILGTLAHTFEMQGDLKGARPLRERSLALFDKTLGRDHPMRVHPLGGLALVLSGLGEHAEAERLFREALDLADKSFPPGAPLRAKAHADLAAELRAVGRDAEADVVMAGAEVAAKDQVAAAKQ